MEQWPPIPAYALDIAGGRITVVKVSPLVHPDGDVCEGIWDERQRCIEIDAKAPPERQWFAFYHEVYEMRLSDSGLDYVLADKQREAVCAALAMADLAALRRSLPQKRPVKKRAP